MSFRLQVKWHLKCHVLKQYDRLAFGTRITRIFLLSWSFFLCCFPCQTLKSFKYFISSLLVNLLLVMTPKHFWWFVRLSFRRLDANHIVTVPDDSFEGLMQLRHLWLDDNSLTEVPVRPLSNLPSLQALTLALNKITHIPDYAFSNLSSLVVL